MNPQQVYWFKDGKQILKKNVHYKKIRDGDGTCALHIESTTNDDDGNYTVMAANPQVIYSSSVFAPASLCMQNLMFKSPPGPDQLLRPFNSPNRTSQTPAVTFSFPEVSAIPLPVEEAERFDAMQEYETSSLVPLFSSVQSCVREAEAEQTQERFFQPHFLQAPGDMLAHEGKLCRLDCKVRIRLRGQQMIYKFIFISFDLIHLDCLLVLQVSGLPAPELMWLVNGKPIYPDLYHKMMVRENGVHSLVIDPLTQKDAGTYTCVASNKAGRSSFSLDLKVVGMNMIGTPLCLVSKLRWLKGFPLQKKR